jgi:predicted RNA-binding protein with RPS1 domain
MSEKVSVGSIVEGKVSRIKPFGAIVLLPDNTQGLVHISHISTSYVQNIADHLAIGDVIKVKVISSDEVTGKIALSIKETMDKPVRPSKDSKPYGNNENNSFKPKASAPVESGNPFEDMFKDWMKVSNDRHAGLNKRNKRR